MNNGFNIKEALNRTGVQTDENYEAGPFAIMPKTNIEKDRPKKILVTGASSFLGHHVIPLLNKYACMDWPDKSIRIMRHFEILTPSSKELNLLDRQNVIDYIKKHQPDTILHMAARCGGIGANKDSPAFFIHDNVKMSSNLFDAIGDVNNWGNKQHNYKNIVTHFYGLGSICCYPKNCPVPFKEDDMWNGRPEASNAPYSESKRLMLVMQQAYRDQFGLKGAHLVPVNLYGTHDKFDLRNSHVVPGLIRKFITAKEDNYHKVEIWGDGTPTREFLNAKDAAIAICTAIVSRLDYSEPINLGTGNEISIKDLAELIKKETGYAGHVYFANNTSLNGQPRRCLDVSRAKEILGFEAKTTLIDGLKETIEWYKKEFVKKDKILCINDCDKKNEEYKKLKKDFNNCFNDNCVSKEALFSSPKFIIDNLEYFKEIEENHPNICFKDNVVHAIEEIYKDTIKKEVEESCPNVSVKDVGINVNGSDLNFSMGYTVHSHASSLSSGVSSKYNGINICDLKNAADFVISEGNKVNDNKYNDNYVLAPSFCHLNLSKKDKNIFCDGYFNYTWPELEVILPPMDFLGKKEQTKKPLKFDTAQALKRAGVDQEVVERLKLEDKTSQKENLNLLAVKYDKEKSSKENLDNYVSSVLKGEIILDGTKPEKKYLRKISDAKEAQINRVEKLNSDFNKACEVFNNEIKPLPSFNIKSKRGVFAVDGSEISEVEIMAASKLPKITTEIIKVEKLSPKQEIKNRLSKFASAIKVAIKDLVQGEKTNE